MKICIMGPVPSKTVYGGVAVFDESIGMAFQSKGFDVFYCSEQSKEGNDHYKISFLNVNKVIGREKPDIIIASLSYAKYYPFITHKCVKIFFLHGFFNVAHYGFVKANLGLLYQKLLVKKCDRVYANSTYTSVINDDIMGVRVDKVALIGVSEKLIEKAKKETIVAARSNGKLIFAGRLAQSKKVDVAIQAVRKLHSEGYNFQFDIIGDGPEENRLKRMASGDHQINFIGRLNQDLLFEKQKDAEVFISLCPSESYGMAYVEALMAGCKIICPQTGGQLEPLHNYSSWVVQVNPMDVDAVASGIKKAFSLMPRELNTGEFECEFSYKNTVETIMKDLQLK